MFLLSVHFSTHATFGGIKGVQRATKIPIMDDRVGKDGVKRNRSRCSNNVEIKEIIPNRPCIYDSSTTSSVSTACFPDSRCRSSLRIELSHIR